MTHRAIVRCSCGHYDEIIAIHGKVTREERDDAKRHPCIRCQIAEREKAHK